MARQNPADDSCVGVLTRGAALLLLAIVATTKTVRIVRKRGRSK